MSDIALAELTEWRDFYVIVGSAGAVLTGLMFVVVTLGAEHQSMQTGALKAFATPNVVHFCLVLLLAAVLCAPRLSFAQLVVSIAAIGAGGLALMVYVLVQARRQRHYQPELSDWIWHTALPFLAYSGLVISAGLLRRQALLAMDLVGGSALALLFVGIHNSWDSAIWIASTRKR